MKFFIRAFAEARSRAGTAGSGGRRETALERETRVLTGSRMPQRGGNVTPGRRGRQFL